jgi:chemotaxis protein CheC
MNELRHGHDWAMDTLYELFASATHDASAAMCRWTNGLITVTLDQVREIALEEVSAELKIGDELLTMVVLTIGGEVGGNLILLFDDVKGRQLAASLLGREPGTEPEWSDLEKSALTETGNILGCAYVNALTRLIGTDLMPSAPYFIQDYGASVVQQAVMTQALTSDRLLLCQIGFRRKDEQLDWRVVFVPTQGMQEAMQRSLHAAS